MLQLIQQVLGGCDLADVVIICDVHLLTSNRYTIIQCTVVTRQSSHVFGFFFVFASALSSGAIQWLLQIAELSLPFAVKPGLANLLNLV